MKTCVLLDYNNLMHRAIHQAFSEQRSLMDRSYGETMRIPDVYTLWKNTVLETIFKHVAQFDASKFIIAVDSKNYWRKKIYQGYKGKRKGKRDESPVDYDEFFKISDKFLQDFKTYFPNFTIMQVDECEVDDIIAILCMEDLKDYENIIVSTDSDFNQLLQLPNVRRYNSLYKVQSFVDVKNPKKELAIKVICGDSSDEIPNVLVMEGVDFEGKTIGCGDKTAEDILEHGIDSPYVVKKVSAKYKTLKNEDILERVKGNLRRNNMLINFNHIPTEYRQKIHAAFKQIQTGKMEVRNALNFLVKNNMRGLYDRFSSYVPALMKVGSGQ
jgi:5'-3' exonuclease